MAEHAPSQHIAVTLSGGGHRASLFGPGATGLDPEVLVAAGMLEGSGQLDADLTVDKATRRLRELPSPTTVWVRAGAGGQPLDDASAGGGSARWAPPPPPTATLAATLRDAWSAAADRRPPHATHLRLGVRDIAAADRLAAAGTVSGLGLVPMLAAHGGRFAWRWPMRIGVADGVRAAAWVAELGGRRFAGELYDARVVAAGDDRPVEILLVDADDPALPETTLNPYQATCVVMVGTGATAAELLARASDVLRPAIAVGLPAGDVGWFTGLVEHLAHDQPVDVALAMVAPDARVAAEPGVSDLTAVARWAMASCYWVGPAAADLGGAAGTSQFEHEDDGARAVVAASRRLALAGVDPTVEIQLLMAAAPPPEPTGEPPPAAAPRTAPTRRRARPKARALLADICHDGVSCRTALAPDADHELEVRIAVPRRDEEGVAFAEAGVPTGDGVAALAVDVRSDDLGLHATQPLVLPTADRSLPSTTAVVPFRTGADGTVVNLKVVVLHEGRPIQAVRVIATVRSRASRRDRVQVLPITLSAQPEPAPHPTPADVSLDATEPTIVRLGAPDGSSVGLHQVKEVLDIIEQEASRVLASDDAPASLGDERARQLLVTLARRGAQLRDKLADLLIGDATTIAMLVKYDSPVLPLELAYDGPAPERTAKLCAHATNAPPAEMRRCTKASARIVCPYAFWGMSRVVARTIEARPSKVVRRPELASLALRPVLYGAANRADAESPVDARPSDLLEAALATLVGRDLLTRVTSWRAWRSAVKRKHPQMLVVLGHTETEAGESTIEIGRRSRLAQPSLTAAVLASAATPPPLVVLLACASAVAGDTFGALPATFTDKGAAAVVATLTKLKGPHGAEAAAAVVRALQTTVSAEGITLGAALTSARRSLVADGSLVGLLLVAHGEIDLRLTR